MFHERRRPAGRFFRAQRYERGAAFLLTVYIAALTLLLFVGVTLQRTVTEVRASQMSRDSHQAFWIAEAGMDYALARVQRPTSLATTDGQPTTTPFVVDRVRYSVPTAYGSGSFEARTLSARILSPTQQQAVRVVRSVGEQGAHQSALTSTVRETTPLSGVWARRIAIVHGGAEFPDTFFTGDIRTGMASFATTIASGRLVYDGVAKMMDGLWSSKTQHADALEQYLAQPGVSPELISLKNGYMFLNELSERDVDGTRWVWPGKSFEERIPHVAGGVAMGTDIQANEVKLPAPFGSPGWMDMFCSADLVLHSGTTKVIDSGYNEGLTADGKLGVTDWQAWVPSGSREDQILLCVNSIVPAPGAAWLHTLIDEPPRLHFTKKTTIYVTGSTAIDLRSMTVTVGGQPMSLGNMAESVGVQPVWDVSVGAKISAGKVVNGTFQPAPVKIIVAKPRAGQRTGIVWLKPGRLGEGSMVYAPQSLVVVRSRAMADRLSPTMEFQGILGKDVVIEMVSDAAQLGWRPGSASSLPLATSTQLLNWGRDDR